MKTDADSQYRAGFLNAFNGKPRRQESTGIDWYHIGFDHGNRSIAHPPGMQLIHEKPCVNGIERVYLHNFVKVHCRFSIARLQWEVWIPGHYVRDTSLVTAILSITNNFNHIT